MLSVYPAIFCKEDNGYSVLFPDLNWLATCGDTLEEAMAMAVDCLAGYLYECRKGHHTCRTPLHAYRTDSKPCVCRRSAYLAFL